MKQNKDSLDVEIGKAVLNKQGQRKEQEMESAYNSDDSSSSTGSSSTSEDEDDLSPYEKAKQRIQV